MFRTLRNLKTFEYRHEGALQAYLRQAVMNRIRDEIRRNQRVNAVPRRRHARVIERNAQLLGEHSSALSNYCLPAVISERERVGATEIAARP